MSDIKQGAMSIPQTAKYWSVSRGTAYAILRENPWIRVLAIYGSKRAVPVEDAEKYLSRCKIVGISAKSNKLKGVEAARLANKTKKAARTVKPIAAELATTDSAAV